MKFYKKNNKNFMIIFMSDFLCLYVSFSARDDMRLQNFDRRSQWKIKKCLLLILLHEVENYSSTRPLLSRTDSWTHYMFFLRGDEGKLLKNQ